MILLSRPLAGRFRAVARRCVVGRPRGPSPPVIVERTADAMKLRTHLGAAALGLTLPASGGPAETLVISSSLLDEIASSREGIAEITVDAEGSRCLCDGRESRWPPLEFSNGPLILPKRMKPVDASFLNALHECGRSAARDNVRYALSRLQIQGKAGKIVGTDGRQLLVWGGWEFPFDESILIPALPVFNGRELAIENEIHLGRSERHFVVTAGPWTVGLAIDGEGRFPDVAQVIPSVLPSELHIHEDDRNLAIAMLEQIVKSPDESPAVTVDFGGRPTLRAKVDASGRVSEVVLARSSATGEPASVAMNRDHLVRALSLGFGSLSVPSDDGPVVFRDRRRTFVTTTLHPS